MKTAKPFARSTCAIANSLDILGDKWSLLVVRDLLHGKQTYGELALSPERIPTNILADRLKRCKAPASSPARLTSSVRCATPIRSPRKAPRWARCCLRLCVGANSTYRVLLH